ncbi:hypothetical protein IC619_006640 [Hazenella sp. IB182353]|uniref:hypothetical protein n=1 Tax=Polycladospora coralii TaxID=2771432 RepID=UPI001746E46C|nr:hypothetical protein [Polycladospora coralii]MBS7530172.1 hypothetical protein [Polycladospora coralii]
MRRIVSFMMALALILSIMPMGSVVFAEKRNDDLTEIHTPDADEPKKEDDGTVVAPHPDEPKKEGDGTVVTPHPDEPQKEDDGTVVIPDADEPQKEDDGTVVIPDAEEPKKEDEATDIYIDEEIPAEKMKALEECEVQYHNPEKLKLSINKNMNGTEFTVAASSEGDQIEGLWLFAVSHLDDFTHKDEFDNQYYEATLVQKQYKFGNSATWSFAVTDLENRKGKYEVFAQFLGTIDGEKCITRVSSIETELIEDEDNEKPENTEVQVVKINNPGTQASAEEKQKEEIVESAKGGPLPQTANDYHNAMLVGFFITLIGASVLIISNVKSN